MNWIFKIEILQDRKKEMENFGLIFLESKKSEQRLDGTETRPDHRQTH